MRFLIAQFSHETNTFSPVPTPIARFCREGDTPLSGEAAIAHYRGTGTGMGGFLDLAASVGARSWCRSRRARRRAGRSSARL